MKISNWDKWQTFRKDRGAPPWIKVYRNLLSNEQWVELTDAEKGQLVSIWMLAADKDGTIPDSAKMIQRMAMLDSKPNINKFIELGFMSTTCQPHVNQEENLCLQLDAPEESRGEEIRVDKTKEDSALDQSKIDHDMYEFCFNQFWESGIRKVNKKKAKVLFISILKKNSNPNGPTAYDFSTRLDSDVKARINAQQMGFSEMHPTTYLNGERWTDEIKEANNAQYQQPTQQRISTVEQSLRETAAHGEQIRRRREERQARRGNDEALGITND